MAGLAYLGRGEFIPGVPARDLDAEEARRFRAVIEEHRRHTGRALYGPPIATGAAAAENAGSAERGQHKAKVPPALPPLDGDFQPQSDVTGTDHD